jgi:hypothetical protein
MSPDEGSPRDRLDRELGLETPITRKDFLDAALIGVGHSELNGHQNVTGAMSRGRRAAQQVLDLL